MAPALSTKVKLELTAWITAVVLMAILIGFMAGRISMENDAIKRGLGERIMSKYNLTWTFHWYTCGDADLTITDIEEMVKEGSWPEAMDPEAALRLSRTLSGRLNEIH
jgi:hypothetical protein